MHGQIITISSLMQTTLSDFGQNKICWNRVTYFHVSLFGRRTKMPDWITHQWVSAHEEAASRQIKITNLCLFIWILFLKVFFPWKIILKVKKTCEVLKQDWIGLFSSRTYVFYRLPDVYCLLLETAAWQQEHTRTQTIDGCCSCMV